VRTSACRREPPRATPRHGPADRRLNRATLAPTTRAGRPHLVLQLAFRMQTGRAGVDLSGEERRRGDVR
jgi:hypothetical protein